MADAEKVAIVSHLYVSLRHKLKRTIDVEWALCDRPYAEEIIRLCRVSEFDELIHYAGRLEALIAGSVVASAPPPEKPVDRYVGALR